MSMLKKIKRKKKIQKENDLLEKDIIFNENSSKTEIGLRLDHLINEKGYDEVVKRAGFKRKYDFTKYFIEYPNQFILPLLNNPNAFYYDVIVGNFLRHLDYDKERYDGEFNLLINIYFVNTSITNILKIYKNNLINEDGLKINLCIRHIRKLVILLNHLFNKEKYFNENNELKENYQKYQYLIKENKTELFTEFLLNILNSKIEGSEILDSFQNIKQWLNVYIEKKNSTKEDKMEEEIKEEKNNEFKPITIEKFKAEFNRLGKIENTDKNKKERLEELFRNFHKTLEIKSIKLEEFFKIGYIQRKMFLIYILEAIEPRHRVAIIAKKFLSINKRATFINLLIFHHLIDYLPMRKISFRDNLFISMKFEDVQKYLLDNLNTEKSLSKIQLDFVNDLKDKYIISNRRTNWQIFFLYSLYQDNYIKEEAINWRKSELFRHADLVLMNHGIHISPYLNSKNSYFYIDLKEIEKNILIGDLNQYGMRNYSDRMQFLYKKYNKQIIDLDKQIKTNKITNVDNELNDTEMVIHKNIDNFFKKLFSLPNKKSDKWYAFKINYLTDKIAYLLKQENLPIQEDLENEIVEYIRDLYIHNVFKMKDTFNLVIENNVIKLVYKTIKKELNLIPAFKFKSDNDFTSNKKDESLKEIKENKIEEGDVDNQDNNPVIEDNKETLVETKEELSTLIEGKFVELKPANNIIDEDFIKKFEIYSKLIEELNNKIEYNKKLEEELNHIKEANKCKIKTHIERTDLMKYNSVSLDIKLENINQKKYLFEVLEDYIDNKIGFPANIKMTINVDKD